MFNRKIWAVTVWDGCLTHTLDLQHFHTSDSGQFFGRCSCEENPFCAATPYSLTSLVSEKSFQPSRLPNKKCKAGHAGLANQPANQLPSGFELGRNSVNSWNTPKPWMQLLHQCLPCSSSPGCLPYCLSPSRGQSQQPCLHRWDRSDVQQTYPWITRSAPIFIWYNHRRKHGGEAVQPLWLPLFFSQCRFNGVSICFCCASEFDAYKSSQVLTRFPAT